MAGVSHQERNQEDSPMTRLTFALAAAALGLLAASDRADAQVTFSVGQPTYAAPVYGQTYPYGYAPAAPATGYRSSYYAPPGYAAPGYAAPSYYAPAAPAPTYYSGRYTYRNSNANTWYTPGWNTAPSNGYYNNGGYTNGGYAYPSNSPVNIQVPGLGNIGIGGRR
jgi:hypothetical protein